MTRDERDFESRDYDVFEFKLYDVQGLSKNQTSTTPTTYFISISLCAEKQNNLEVIRCSGCAPDS